MNLKIKASCLFKEHQLLWKNRKVSLRWEIYITNYKVKQKLPIEYLLILCTYDSFYYFIIIVTQIFGYTIYTRHSLDNAKLRRQQTSRAAPGWSWSSLLGDWQRRTGVHRQYIGTEVYNSCKAVVRTHEEHTINS